MEERKSYGMVVLFVSVFVVFLVSIMSYSLWRDKQISAFMATNRARVSSVTGFLRSRGWSGVGSG